MKRMRRLAVAGVLFLSSFSLGAKEVPLLGGERSFPSEALTVLLDQTKIMNWKQPVNFSGAEHTVVILVEPVLRFKAKIKITPYTPEDLRRRAGRVVAPSLVPGECTKDEREIVPLLGAKENLDAMCKAYGFVGSPTTGPAQSLTVIEPLKGTSLEAGISLKILEEADGESKPKKVRGRFVQNEKTGDGQYQFPRVKQLACLKLKASAPFPAKQEERR